MRRTFVVNPAAAACPRDLRARVLARFPDARVRYTEAPGDGARLADEAVRTGEGRVVVACGGDGTLREVAGAVGARTLLGILPLGTVNLVSRELGIPRELEGALEVVARGVAREVFPGRCAVDGEREGHPFFLAVSAGPDADAVHAVGGDKRLLGRYAYAARFLARLARPMLPCVSWEAGRVGGGRCAELLVLRSPRYGGDYRVSDRVSLFEPSLEVVTVAPGRTRVARFFWDVWRSRVVSRGGVSRLSTGQVRVIPGPGGRFQMDGDAFRAGRLRLWCDPEPLRILGWG